MIVLKTFKNLRTVFLSSLLLLFYFGYFYFRIDPKLLYQTQQPVFFWDLSFFREFTAYAGGLNEWASALLAQFYYTSWSGALLLTALFGLAAFMTRRFLTILTPDPVPLIHWLPSLFLFSLYNDYSMPLTIILGFLVAVTTTVLFIRFAPKTFVGRLVVFMLSYSLLYYVTGGPVLLFVLLCHLYDLFYQRRYIPSFVYLLCAAVIPYLSYQYLMILPFHKAYLLHLGWNLETPQSWALYGLWFSMPVVLIIVVLNKKRSARKGSSTGKSLFSPQSGYAAIISFTFILLLLGFMSVFSFQKKEKALATLDYQAHNGQWRNVINTVQDYKLLGTYIGQFQLNRALYHSGRLCEAMFSFPQPFKYGNLFLPGDIRHLYPLQYSDLFYDLGLINEAQHWAHEALSVTGDTPANLKRLAMVYILKHEYAVARKCLELLRKTLWFKSWARDILYRMEKDSLTSLSDVQRVTPLQLTHDYLVIPSQPQACLEELLESNNTNRMAFEYYMCGLLLDGKVGRFINQLPRMQPMNTQRIPRHFEEAILLYIMNTGRRDLPIDIKISVETLRNFQDYVSIVKRHPSVADAYSDLATKYRHTFWFYAGYVYKKD